MNAEVRAAAYAEPKRGAKKAREAAEAEAARLALQEADEAAEVAKQQEEDAVAGKAAEVERLRKAKAKRDAAALEKSKKRKADSPKRRKAVAADVVTADLARAPRKQAKVHHRKRKARKTTAGTSADDSSSGSDDDVSESSTVSESDADAGVEAVDEDGVSPPADWPTYTDAVNFIMAFAKMRMAFPLTNELWKDVYLNSETLWRLRSNQSMLTAEERRRERPVTLLNQPSAAQLRAVFALAEGASEMARLQPSGLAAQPVVRPPPAGAMVPHPSQGQRASFMVAKAPKGELKLVTFGSPPFAYECGLKSIMPAAAWLAVQYSGTDFGDVFGDKKAMDTLAKRVRREDYPYTADQVVLALQSGSVKTFRTFAPTEGEDTSMAVSALSLRQLERSVASIIHLFSWILGETVPFLRDLRNLQSERWLEHNHGTIVGQLVVMGVQRDEAMRQACTYLLASLDTAMATLQRHEVAVLQDHFSSPDSLVGITGWAGLPTADSAPRAVSGIHLGPSGGVLAARFTAVSFQSALGRVPLFAPQVLAPRVDRHTGGGTLSSRHLAASHYVAKAATVRAAGMPMHVHSARESVVPAARSARAGGQHVLPSPMLQLPQAVQTVIKGRSAVQLMQDSKAKAMLMALRQVGGPDQTLCFNDLLAPGSCTRGSSCKYVHLVRSADSLASL